MSEFNLLDEGWISVVTDYKGTTKLVGMKEFFKDAHSYIALAGDTKTQDFAVMRFLLAVLHTVFSRYDADGKPYEMIELNKRMQQVEEVYEEDESDYKDALMDTWKDLWNKGKFPEIVDEYLEAWRDRFYLFDGKYPFYQVTKDFFNDCKLYSNQGAAKEAGRISFKTINRKISETGKKVAIFSMVSGNDSELKGELSSAQLTRWLIHYMAYSATPDKTKIKSYLDIKDIEKYDGHKGWQNSIGAIHYKTDNLFMTLLLNLILVHPDDKFRNKIQTPAWELTPEENIRFYLNNNNINNLARLYTDYSRAVYISNERDENGRFLNIAQLPALDKKNNLLECMTIWGRNKNDVEEKWYPIENKPYESLWRNFGIIYLNNLYESEHFRSPSIVDWFRRISKETSDERYIKLSAVGINSATASNLMKNDIDDEIYISLEVSYDLAKNGWLSRINNLVENTKKFLNEEYKKYATDVVALDTGLLRSNATKKQKELIDARINSLIGEIYFKIDKPFKDWLSSIDYTEDKEKKLYNCKKMIVEIIKDESKRVALAHGDRAFVGIKFKLNNDVMYNNIAISFNKLILKLINYEKGDL
ncbi:hypothetical protein HMPREF2800_01485 [Anaerosphaera sp. HMSC064C01]|nr:hypothetical protein HMPREF2800_01485 [Anaerosphaera sp. HMSC064C01]